MSPFRTMCQYRPWHFRSSRRDEEDAVAVSVLRECHRPGQVTSTKGKSVSQKGVTNGERIVAALGV